MELSLVPSWEFTLLYMQEIGAAVRSAFANGANGVVVTQGTDTLEETAFWLDLTLDLPALGGPLVITGADRNNSEIGADGPRNITDAVTVASEGSRGFAAPVVVANSQVQSARFVTKTDSFNQPPFKAPVMVPLVRCMATLSCTPPTPNHWIHCQSLTLPTGTSHQVGGRHG